MLATDAATNTSDIVVISDALSTEVSDRQSDIKYLSDALSDLAATAGAAAGNDTEVQYNDGGTLGGNASLTFDKTTGVLTATGTIDAHTGKVLVEDNDTLAPDVENDGYMGVAVIGGIARVYFAVNGSMYYINGTIVAAPVVGNPIGLLLVLTYAA